MRIMPDNILLVIRHGETDWNAAGRFQGHSDIALNQTGREQATANGVALNYHLNQLGIEPAGVNYFSSPLRRAVETMQLVLGTLGLQKDVAVNDPRLMEASFGDWEGLTTHEVKQRFPALRKMRKADRWNFRPPGGQSFADLELLAIDFLASIERSRPSVVVSHSGNIRVIGGLLQGLIRDRTMAQGVPHHGILSWNGHSWGLI